MPQVLLLHGQVGMYQINYATSAIVNKKHYWIEAESTLVGVVLCSMINDQR